MSARHGVAGSGSAATEFLHGLGCGIVFGLASPLSSHPLDTVKTRLAALPALSRAGLRAALFGALRSQGGPGLYAGLAYPLLGSALFRSLQFSAYGAVYGGSAGSAALCAERPSLGGLQLRVLLAAAAATTARALVETPLEVFKVRRMVGAPLLPPRSLAGGAPAAAALLREVYTGLGLTWARLFVALGGFFVLTDLADRRFPGAFESVGGAFLKGALCATVPWALAWPLEVAKTQAQSTLHEGHAERGAVARLAGIARRGGARALFAGLAPGLARSLVGNGAALAAYQLCRTAVETAD